MNIKKWVFVFSILTCLFLGFHIIVWIFFTSKIFSTDPHHVGDLSRMSYQLDSIAFRDKRNITLPNKHITAGSYNIGQDIDILTIGDSFFNAGAGGLNPFFQDYLATKTNLRILNIQSLKTGYSELDTINILYNSGWLDTLKPKAIIIETVQRLAIPRYARKYDFNKTMQYNEIKDDLLTDAKWKKFLEVPSVSFINTGNYKFLYYAFLYQYKENAQKNVYKFKLTKELFNVKNKDSLLVYYDDIISARKVKTSDIELINHNFNMLADKLETKGIKLYFMVAANKFDAYYDCLENKGYAISDFFNILDSLEKKYYFINTLNILKPLIKDGVLDIYFADDTHWSYKASEAISKDKIFDTLNAF